MADIIFLDQRRNMKERIQAAKRLGQMQTTDLSESERLLRDGQTFQFYQSDSAIEKLIKLAHNTVVTNRKKTEAELLGEGYTDGMDD